MAYICAYVHYIRFLYFYLNSNKPKGIIIVVHTSGHSFCVLSTHKSSFVQKFMLYLFGDVELILPYFYLHHVHTFVWESYLSLYTEHILLHLNTVWMF